MSSGKKNGRSFRLARSAMEQEDAMENAVPCCTRYKNKWAVVLLKEWQFYRVQKRQAIEVHAAKQSVDTPFKTMNCKSMAY